MKVYDMLIDVSLGSFNVFATIIIAARSPVQQVQPKYLNLSSINLVDCCLRFPSLPPHFMAAKYRHRPDGIARRFPLQYSAQHQAESPSTPPNKEHGCVVDCCVFAAFSLGAPVAPVLASRATDADANTRHRGARCLLLHQDAAFGRRAPPRHPLMAR